MQQSSDFLLARSDVRVASAASSFYALGSNRSLVSGRARELAALRTEWQRSTLGELRVALVLGDPGLGKTRLATELVPHDSQLAVGLITHSCVMRTAPPIGPWVDALGLPTGPQKMLQKTP